MRIVAFDEDHMYACAEFWWKVYRNLPYVHRPDGYQTINTPPTGPDPGYFVKHLKAGLSGRNTNHWEGTVTSESIILAMDRERVAGILVSSIDDKKLSGNILSAYVQRDQSGWEVADRLLSEAIERFRKRGLRRAVASPGPSKSMEVECPIHLALLDAGFSWVNDWVPAYPNETYGVFLGGSLENFHLIPEIENKIAELHREGILIERCAANRFCYLQRLDTGENVGDLHGDITFIALVDGCVVGWLPEVVVYGADEYGRVTGEVVPEVIPIYRRRGIGKVLYHLGIEEVVRRGATCGWTATEIYNPARLIYRSIGYRYWYTAFSRMSRLLI